MADYKEVWKNPTDPTIIGYQKTGTGLFLMLNCGGPDWQDFLNWQAGGGVADPAFTQAEIDEWSLNGRQMDRLGTLRQATIDQFKMILAIFQVGKDKGVWVNADFDVELRQKAADWIQLINDYESEA